MKAAPALHAALQFHTDSVWRRQPMHRLDVFSDASSGSYKRLPREAQLKKLTILRLSY
jgi:hypothetical protein